MPTKSTPYKKPTRGWPPKRRAEQAERCRIQKPWKNATGPKTTSGKKKSSQNAHKHGHHTAQYRAELTRLRKLLKHHRLYLSAYKTQIQRTTPSTFFAPRDFIPSEQGTMNNNCNRKTNNNPLRHGRHNRASRESCLFGDARNN